MLRPLLVASAAICALSSLLAAPQPAPAAAPAQAAPAPSIQDFPDRVIVSVKDQKLMVVHNNQRVAIYPVSTSKYGLGDYLGRMTTPLGFLQVAAKIGDNAPTGAVFHNRRFTGEVLKPNAPGRDPVITRIIWLRGLEAQNAHAFGRCIYIHGTPEERYIGRPASYGCVRMKSRDVTALYNELPVGALIQIIPDHLPKLPKAKRTAAVDAWRPALPAGTTVATTGLLVHGDRN